MEYTPMQKEKQSAHTIHMYPTNLVALHVRADVLVPHDGVLLLQSGELVEVRREQATALQGVDDVVRDRPGQSEAVKRRGACL